MARPIILPPTPSAYKLANFFFPFVKNHTLLTKEQKLTPPAKLIANLLNKNFLRDSKKSSTREERIRWQQATF